jgi:hypothetical protein
MAPVDAGNTTQHTHRRPWSRNLLNVAVLVGLVGIFAVVAFASSFVDNGSIQAMKERLWLHSSAHITQSTLLPAQPVEEDTLAPSTLAAPARRLLQLSPRALPQNNAFKPSLPASGSARTVMYPLLNNSGECVTKKERDLAALMDIQTGDQESRGTAIVTQYKAAICADRIYGHPCRDMMTWNVCNFAVAHYWDVSAPGEATSLNTATLVAAVDHFIAKGIKKAFRILMKTSQLHEFIAYAWPTLVKKRVSYVIVTCCSDMTLPSNSSVHAVLDNPKIVRWFAQNAALEHPKITRTPIGIDFHSLAKRAAWNTQSDSPQHQNAFLLELHAKAKATPVRSRQLVVLVNFNAHTSFRRLVNADLHTHLPDEAIHVMTSAARQSVWNRYLDVEFVISPPGNGKDCHRTWEAILMGAIPIVLRDSPYDNVYNGFPVVIVNSYRDVTMDRLMRWRSELRPRVASFLKNPQRLTSVYWMARIMEASEIGG